MTHLLRALIIAISALLLATTMLVSAPAQAAGLSTSTVRVATATPKALTTSTVRRKADVSVGWTGYNIKFNRTETRAIAAGAGSCSVVVGKLPALPAKVLSAACGLLVVLAGYALSDGRCLSAGVYYWGQPHFGTWRC